MLEYAYADFYFLAADIQVEGLQSCVSTQVLNIGEHFAYGCKLGNDYK